MRDRDIDIKLWEVVSTFTDINQLKSLRDQVMAGDYVQLQSWFTANSTPLTQFQIDQLDGKIKIAVRAISVMPRLYYRWLQVQSDARVEGHLKDILIQAKGDIENYLELQGISPETATKDFKRALNNLVGVVNGS